MAHRITNLQHIAGQISTRRAQTWHMECPHTLRDRGDMCYDIQGWVLRTLQCHKCADTLIKTLHGAPRTAARPAEQQPGEQRSAPRVRGRLRRPPSHKPLNLGAALPQPPAAVRLEWPRKWHQAQHFIILRARVHAMVPQPTPFVYLAWHFLMAHLGHAS